MANISKHKILFRELFPFTFVVILWLVHITKEFLNADWWNDYSLYPKTLHGLIGIFTAPLLHEDFSHLFWNSIPLLVLGYLLFTMYRDIAAKIFWLIYFLPGCLDWFFARDGFHLGASGVVYGMASFLFFSGVIRRHAPLMVISLLVVFLYGSLFWGIFPVDPHVSWESHLNGALVGAFLAVIFRKEGPQRPVTPDDDEENNEDENSADENSEHENNPVVPPTDEPQQPVIRYLYKEKGDEGK